jgi:hypothetical protein
LGEPAKNSYLMDSSENAGIVMSAGNTRAGKKQSTWSRMFWFGVGAGGKYFLILIPFNYLKAHTSLSTIVISGASLAVSTTFFFFWNYFLNFRTDSGTGEALARYLAAASFMWLISTLTLSFFKALNLCSGFKIGTYPVDIDIISLQVCLSGVKFLLYHKWVFPAEKAGDGKQTALVRVEGVLPEQG